jgi:hypothetical protein
MATPRTHGYPGSVVDVPQRMLAVPVLDHALRHGTRNVAFKHLDLDGEGPGHVGEV